MQNALISLIECLIIIAVPVIIIWSIIYLRINDDQQDDLQDSSEEESREKWPYLRKNYLLSVAEKKFYFIVLEILENEYLLFAKVRISDLVYLPKYQTEKRHYWNKIQSKHVDFLICSKENVRPLLVIELDDSSHLKDDRILRDEFVDEIFKDADLPILHIKNSYNYNFEELQNEIISLLK